MDRTALQATVRTGAQAALQATPEGALWRRRFLGLGGLTLLVLGFLAAIGFSRFIVWLLLALVVAGAAVALVPVLRRSRTRAAQTLEARAARRSEAARERQLGRLNAQGTEFRRKGDAAQAIAAHEAALQLAREVGDRNAEAMTLNNLALALGYAGDDQGAVVRFDEAASILRELDDPHHEGQVMANLGFLHGRSGRREQAIYCLESALGKLEPKSSAYRKVEEQLRRAS